MEEINTQNIETCPEGHPIKTVPAGISKKTGNSYNAFQVCEDRQHNWKPIAPPKSYTPRPAKTEQMKQVINYKNEGIKESQDRKNDSIRLSSAGRDATLIVTSFYKYNGFVDEEAIKRQWLVWREWLYNRMGEVPQPDKEPFESRITNAPEYDDWPPPEIN